METTLRRWWVKKYQTPWTSKHFQNATIDELLVEFYEDYYEANPSEQLKDLRDDDGNITFATGDELIDKWEQELAMGLTPDLNEGLSLEERQKETATFKKAKEQTTGFSDNYGDDSETYKQKLDLLNRLKKNTLGG